jgi:hypothetical protein
MQSFPPVGAVIEDVNELEGKSSIAPPGQEGWREAPGWSFNQKKYGD